MIALRAAIAEAEEAMNRYRRGEADAAELSGVLDAVVEAARAALPAPEPEPDPEARCSTCSAWRRAPGSVIGECSAGGRAITTLGRMPGCPLWRLRTETGRKGGSA